MSLWRVNMCINLPLLALLHKGLVSILLVLVLILFAWIPGILGVYIICNKTN